MQVQVVERTQQIMLQEQEIIRKEKELEAKIKKPAEAEKYKLEKIAEAQRWVLDRDTFIWIWWELIVIERHETSVACLAVKRHQERQN